MLAVAALSLVLALAVACLLPPLPALHADQPGPPAAWRPRCAHAH